MLEKYIFFSEGCIVMKSIQVRKLNLYIGKKLREKRKKAGLTLENISSAVNVTYQQVQKYESGQSKIPLLKLYELSILYRVPLQHFFEGIEKILTDDHKITQNEDFITSKIQKISNILIIDDNPVDEFFTRKAINETDKNIKVFCVNTEEQIMDFLKYKIFSSVAPKPDLIFMDISINKKNGFNLLNLIRKEQTTQDIPIIVLTNCINISDMLNVYKAGAVSFIRKSIDYVELKKIISSCLGYWGNTVTLPNIANQKDVFYNSTK